MERDRDLDWTIPIWKVPLIMGIISVCVIVIQEII